MVNVHFSLLPRWRGAAPVERAILAGDDQTGVCLMAIDEGLDTGPVYRCAAGRDRSRTRPPPSCGPGWPCWAPACWSTGPGARVWGAPTPQEGDADLRRQDRAGGSPPRLGPAGRRAAPGRPRRAGLDHAGGAGACWCWPARGRRPRRDGRPASSTGDVVATGERRAARWSRAAGRARPRWPRPMAARAPGPGPTRPWAMTPASRTWQPLNGRRRPRRALTARRLALDALDRRSTAGPGPTWWCPTCWPARSLDDRDRALVTELVYGTCRMRRACDWLADRHARGPLDAEVRAALRLGAYQLGWTRIPPHAAVSATVDEVRGPGPVGGQRGAAPGGRRSSESGPVAWPDPATELSYPDWIVARLARDLGPGGGPRRPRRP